MVVGDLSAVMTLPEIVFSQLMIFVMTSTNFSSTFQETHLSEKVRDFVKMEKVQNIQLYRYRSLGVKIMGSLHNLRIISPHDDPNRRFRESKLATP